ncbi:hypothetical protein SAMN02745136_02367 [Anaerocolumna jejuensis DSM 15929]|uniref:PTS HPr component phosphorylation site n=1 Tax=Anaerocolumna jejuensis DSM 15929 TaxID=1121322 RepID=A0A1M6S180_9FIRM|nr:hypothetical protein [Anaerocolumna jejuensis]SHK38436.1 hypothetical protein SAMN02745136_02367 [Anaerocolumna jejuensis DSM 15929]
MKTKTVVFKSANDLYEFNRQAERCMTDIRVKTPSGTYDFDAKTLLGLFFALSLPSIDVNYDESESEFDEYLTSLERTE